MTRLLYSFLMWLAQPFLRRKLAQRGVQEPGYLEAVEEHFAYYTDTASPWGAEWQHALGPCRVAR